MTLTLIALLALGGIVALDATSFGQLMLSRPMIAGIVAGAIVGMPFEGALIGALLEALSLGILPVGAARYPDTGTAAVGAVGALGISAAVPTPPVLLMVVVFGLLWQQVAGRTVIGGRYINERVVRAGRPGRERMDRMIELRHIEAMLLDILRGVLVTAAALLIGTPLFRLGVANWTLPVTWAAIALSAAAAAVLAGTAPLFAETPRGRVLFIVGLLSGSILVALR